MDHQEAQRAYAADRYLLGELSAEECEQFEEHFFSCPECATEVRAGMIFRANAAAVLQEEAVDVDKAATRQPVREGFPKLGWLGWLTLRPAVAGAWAAVCLLAVGVGYQSFVTVPRLQDRLNEFSRPQAYQSFALRPLTRGEDLVLRVPKGRRFVGLSVHVDPRHSFQTYRGEILDETGVVRISVVSTAPVAPGYPLEFLLPTSSLTPGAYEMVVRGVNPSSLDSPGTETGTYRFVITHD